MKLISTNFRSISHYRYVTPSRNNVSGIYTNHYKSAVILENTARYGARLDDPKAVTLETSVQSIILVSNLGVTIGLAFPLLGHLAYSMLFVSSRAVPRSLSLLSIVASVIGIVGALLGLATPDLLFVLTDGIIIVMLDEIVLGIWLIS